MLYLNWLNVNLQLCACRAEALLKLHQLNDAYLALSNIPELESHTTYPSQLKVFGMHPEAYLFFVQAQIELSMGKLA